jgi:mono/diheme cytochrome c family protein
MTVVACLATGSAQSPSVVLGDERAVAHHLSSGEELKLPLRDLVAVGRTLFTANWTAEDGGGRPLTKGSGMPLSDRHAPLAGDRGFNRVSGPEAMSCAACHRHPFAIAGGGGDFVSNAFEGADRFDFATFDRDDAQPTRGARDEAGRRVSLQTIGNLRSTSSLFGAGYLEMLARQMTADLQRTRDSLQPGRTKPLVSKGVSFGTLARRADGRWDTHAVEGLPPQSLTAPAGRPPSLVIRPWQQSGTVVSLREMINTSYNQHLGIQTTERFGLNTDPDGDGVRNEMTQGDVSAVAAFIATLQVPGRVVPNQPEAAKVVATGEQLFDQIGCAGCHRPALPLARSGWTYSEPGPYNQAGNLVRSAGIRLLSLDLSADTLPQPRLELSGDTIVVPAFTDFKLHDITDASDDTARESLDLNRPRSSNQFHEGNRRFLTRRLWDVGSRPQFFHDGRFTTVREAVLAHSGEALEPRRAFERLSTEEQRAVLRFLGSMQIVPPHVISRIVDENFRPKVLTRRETATPGLR